MSVGTSGPRGLRALLPAVALCLAACASPVAAPSPEDAVAQRLATYVDLLRRQDAAGLADLFEPSGLTQHEGQPPIVGRAAIRSFLESFAGYRVLAHEMTVRSVDVSRDAVVQRGDYAQTVLAPGGERLQAAGRFVAEWRRDTGGPWLIRSMRTGPSKEQTG